uniref:Uncharacterized protein n=1 Tax=Sphingobacterium sp. (strain 21) TaxID=743722 RepID=F4C9Y0_SPHS2
MRFQNEVLLQTLDSRLKKSEVCVFFATQEIFAKGIKYAKEGEIEQSTNCFLLGETELNKVDNNTELKRWLLFSYLSKRSFLHYKTGNKDKAVEYLCRYKEVLNWLIERGVKFLVFPFIQYQHNMARILFYERDTRAAITQVIGSLKSLLSSTSKGTQNSFICGVDLLKLIQEDIRYQNIVDLYVGQLMVEVLLSISKSDNFLDHLQTFLRSLNHFWTAYNPGSSFGVALKQFITPFFMSCHVLDQIDQEKLLKELSFIREVHKLPNLWSDLLTAYISKLQG